MLILIDTNCFHCVFDTTSSSHPDFAPVLSFVTEGKGRLVSGGQKYKRELAAQKKYFRFVVELSRAGRVVSFPDKDVDDTAASLKLKVPDKAFNDEHLVALVIVSKCRLICTKDKDSDPYLKDKNRVLYPKGMKRPAIYRYAKHAALLR